jgi:cytoskeleton protein RodZ
MSEQPRFAQPEGNRTAILQVAPDKLSGDSHSASEATVGGVGQRLRNAREARGLSVAEAAQSLKLAPRQVEALEAEDWPSLPGNTMIRGFVRNYARLLGLNSEALMHALDAEHLQQTPKLEASAGTSASLPHVANRVERRDYLAIVAGLLLLVLALLAYLYVPADAWREKMSGLISAFSRTASSDRSPAAPVDRPAETPAAPQAAQQEPSALPAPSGESVTTVTTPSAIVLSDASTPGPQSAGVDQRPADNRLKFTFGQAAWLQVRDGRGQVIVGETNPAGSQREVEGQPPFSLVVGNATQVKLEYRGRVIDLAPYSKGEVARLNVE